MFKYMAVSIIFCAVTAAPTRFGGARHLSTVLSPLVTEASGLAASKIHPGILYTMNDYSSHHLYNKIYAIDSHTGMLVAILTISGAINYDWESLSIGPCPDGRSCLYIGDIGGGNSHPRNTIYRIVEPDELKDQIIHFTDSLHFTWGEHDAECLMVDPVGNTYVISRVLGGRGRVTKLPSDGWGGKTVGVGASSHLSISTTHHDPLGCDISPDGKAVLLKAKHAIYYYSVPDGDYVKALSGHPVTVPYNDKEHFGESIAWTAEGDGYYTLSEGHNPPIYLYHGLN